MTKRGYIPRKIPTLQAILDTPIKKLSNIPDTKEFDDEEKSYEEFIDTYENFNRHGQKKY